MKNRLPQKIWSYCKFDLVAKKKKLPTTQLKTLFHTCSIFQAKFGSWTMDHSFNGPGTNTTTRHPKPRLRCAAPKAPHPPFQRRFHTCNVFKAAVISKFDTRDYFEILWKVLEENFCFFPKKISEICRCSLHSSPTHASHASLSLLHQNFLSKSVNPTNPSSLPSLKLT